MDARGQTVTEPASELADEAPSSDDSSSADEPTASDAQDASGSGGSDAASIKVPDVEGVDHQLAQDTMQAPGLYNLTEEDASGEDRSLLWDRNWTVVTQSPKPGERVSADTTIILRSVKDEEPVGLGHGRFPGQARTQPHPQPRNSAVHV